MENLDFIWIQAWKGDCLPTRLELFKKRMENAEKLYTREISNFAEKFDALGEMTLKEIPDIDTQEYVYCFEKVNGTPQDELDNILLEICDHMDEFSKVNNIENFNRAVIIWLWGADNMDITKYPQFQLYLFTLNLLRLKSLLIPKDCDDRCINSTIINRAYFSSYLFCVLWLEYVKNFRPMPLNGFKSKEERISEHV